MVLPSDISGTPLITAKCAQSEGYLVLSITKKNSPAQLNARASTNTHRPPQLLHQLGTQLKDGYWNK